MKRKFLLTTWLLLPVVLIAYHYGPGQSGLVRDAVAADLRAADACVAGEDWAGAIEHYDNALEALGADAKANEGEHATTMWRVRLEKAKAQMLVSQLPAANREMQKLLGEVTEEGSGAGADLVAETRSALANSQYYLTWLMRLEGLPRAVWQPEIDAARQHYRLLAEGAEKAGDRAASNEQKENLESAIRLARLDLAELQGLPLPSQ